MCIREEQEQDQDIILFCTREGKKIKMLNHKNEWECFLWFPYYYRYGCSYDYYYEYEIISGGEVVNKKVQFAGYEWMRNLLIIILADFLATTRKSKNKTEQIKRGNSNEGEVCRKKNDAKMSAAAKSERKSSGGVACWCSLFGDLFVYIKNEFRMYFR